MATLSPSYAPSPTFSVDQYHWLIETGRIAENERVELLEGRITPKVPHNPPHDATVDLVSEVLRPLLPAGWRIRVQSSITTPDSEPQPDHAIVLGPAARYAQRHPGPGDIGLLIEVSDSSLRDDRGEKARLYARATIGIYWIINLPDRQVEVYTDPTGPDPSPRYRDRKDFRPGESIPLTIGGQALGTVAVSELLPPL